MDQLLRATVAAALAAASFDAVAHAYADVTFESITANQSGSGTAFSISSPDLPPYFEVPPGDTLTEVFGYSITLHTDGLPASRDWESCLPLFELYCGPDATGHEVAAARGGLFDDGREGDPQPPAGPLEYLGTDPWEYSFELTTAGTVTYAGTISVTAYNPSPYFVGISQFAIYSSAWVDSSTLAVPEPGSAALILAGLAGWGFAARRRASGSSTAVVPARPRIAAP